MSLPKNPIVVIPARLASMRLPDKPLADIGGEPMIVHVWRRATAAAIGPVVVACAEDSIAQAVRAAGGQAVLTRADHVSGSDRVYEAVESIDPAGDHDAVVNMQGDLPTIEPRTIAAVLQPLADSTVDIATLAAVIRDPAERDDPNVVKVAAVFPPGVAIARAPYFSRATVPWVSPGIGPGIGLGTGGDFYHHIGLYAFRRAALRRFVELPPSPLERRERLEQLRALEAGMRIDAALVDTVPLGVDTPADLARAREILAPQAG